MTAESTTTSPAEIARFFRRYGWTFDQLDDDTLADQPSSAYFDLSKRQFGT